MAGSQPVSGYSIGGHIHFSNIRLDGGLLRALDNYLGIPIFLIENPVTAAKRRKKYGFIGDYRIKDHGGFEYRVLGSWLINQKITTAVLCLAKIIANRYAEIPQNYLNTAEAQRAFYKGDQEYFRPIFNSLWSNLENLDLYQEYKEELQIIPEMITNHVIWDEKSDLRKGWKLGQPPKRQYSGSKAMGRPSSVISAGRTTTPGSYYSGGTSRTGTSLRSSQVRGSYRVNSDRRSATTTQRGRITSGQIRSSSRTSIIR
jgi:hypothetical protein